MDEMKSLSGELVMGVTDGCVYFSDNRLLTKLPLTATSTEMLLELLRRNEKSVHDAAHKERGVFFGRDFNQVDAN